MSGGDFWTWVAIAVLVLGAPIVFAWFVWELLRRPPGDPPTPPGRS